jgi:hypothetical protein
MNDLAILSNCRSVSKAVDDKIIDHTVTSLDPISSEFPVMMMMMMMMMLIIIIIIIIILMTDADFVSFIRISQTTSNIYVNQRILISNK